MKNLKLEKYFCNSEEIENKIKEMAEKQNISLNACIIDLIEKAYKSQNICDTNIYGVVGERPYKMLEEYFIKGKTYKQIAEENNISSERVRQLVAKGCREMRIRLQIFLKNI